MPERRKCLNHAKCHSFTSAPDAAYCSCCASRGGKPRALQARLNAAVDDRRAQVLNRDWLTCPGVTKPFRDNMPFHTNG